MHKKSLFIVFGFIYLLSITPLFAQNQYSLNGETFSLAYSCKPKKEAFEAKSVYGKSYIEVLSCMSERDFHLALSVVVYPDKLLEKYSKKKLLAKTTVHVKKKKNVKLKVSKRSSFLNNPAIHVDIINNNKPATFTRQITFFKKKKMWTLTVTGELTKIRDKQVSGFISSLKIQ